MKSVIISGSPITANKMYSGRRYLTAEAREFKRTVALMCKDQNFNLQKLEGDLLVLLIYRWRTYHRRDIPNFEKAIMDALKGIMYKDDSQSIVFTGIKLLGQERDSTTLQIYTTEETHAYLSALSQYCNNLCCKS